MILKFKNNNIHLKLDKSEFLKINEEQEPKKVYCLIELLCLNYDFTIASEWYNLGNYCQAVDLCFNGGEAYYPLNTYDIIDLINGKTIVLKPHNDEYIGNYILHYQE